MEWAWPTTICRRRKFLDIAMMVLTGGKERTIPEYRDLLAGADFRLNQVYPTSAEVNVIEAMPS